MWVPASNTLWYLGLALPKEEVVSSHPESTASQDTRYLPVRIGAFENIAAGLYNTAFQCKLANWPKDSGSDTLMRIGSLPVT